jgi:hypothetical protein
MENPFTYEAGALIIKVKGGLLMEEITTVEAAERYGHDISHFRALAANGIVKARKVGRDWLLDVNSLEDYLAEPHPTGPKPRNRPWSTVGRSLR